MKKILILFILLLSSKIYALTDDALATLLQNNYTAIGVTSSKPHLMPLANAINTAVVGGTLPYTPVNIDQTSPQTFVGTWTIPTLHLTNPLTDTYISSASTWNSKLSTVTGTNLDNIWSSNGILKRTGANTYGVITDNSSNWNTAYSWGNPSGTYLPLTGGTLTGKLISTQPTSSIASIGLTSSSNINPTSPSSGDLWWNGTNLYFYNGTTTVDLLVRGFGNSGSPAGSIIAYSGSSIPTGYLDCDGSAVSRTIYADLFSAIGTTWGAGDGTTTFNIPDLRSATLRGVGTPTLYTSNTVISLADTIDDKIQGHFHITRSWNDSAQNDYLGGSSNNYGLKDVDTGNSISAVFGPKSDGVNGTPRTGLETTGKARGVYFLIKATNTTNSYSNEFAYITMSADHSSPATNDVVKFNTATLGNIAISGTPNYAVVLKANRTYILRAQVYPDFTSSSGYLALQFYNVTTGSFIGTPSLQPTATYTGQSGSSSIAYSMITPTVDTTVDLRVKTAVAVNTINKDYSYFEIQQIAETPTIITGQYAYVSPDIDFSSHISYISGGGSISSIQKANCVFYKTSNNVWYMEGNLKLTASSASRSSFVVKVSGVLPDGDGSTSWQNGSGDTNGASIVSYNQMYTSGGESRFHWGYSSATTTHHSSSFRIRLTEKPTGYDLPSWL